MFLLLKFCPFFFENNGMKLIFLFSQARLGEESSLIGQFNYSTKLLFFSSIFFCITVSVSLCHCLFYFRLWTEINLLFCQARLGEGSSLIGQFNYSTKLLFFSSIFFCITVSVSLCHCLFYFRLWTEINLLFCQARLGEGSSLIGQFNCSTKLGQQHKLQNV